MAKPEYLITAQGRKIAYHKTEGTGPGVVFLGGFFSDMEGTKAVYLEQWARETGRAFLRFDYSGHGLSSAKFVEGCIGDWAEDAYEVISHLTEGPQILVGSSMGGWISLLTAKRMSARIAGLVTIAAAPDFTEDSMWEWMDEIMRAKLLREGVVFLPSDYGDPYPITKRLIQDGRKHLVLREPLNLAFPVRMLHGTADEDVKMDVALRLLEHANGDDIRLSFVKGADHRFSDERCLRLIRKAIHSVTNAS
jgi:pimeloyl-ACP methyl ester carboxylesterase